MPVTTDGGRRLGKTVTGCHIDAAGMHKFLHLTRDSSASRGEEVGILKAEGFLEKRDNGLLIESIA